MEDEGINKVAVDAIINALHQSRQQGEVVRIMTAVEAAISGLGPLRNADTLYAAINWAACELAKTQIADRENADITGPMTSKEYATVGGNLIMGMLDHPDMQRQVELWWRAEQATGREQMLREDGKHWC